MPDTDSARESAEQTRVHKVHPPAEPAAEVEPAAPVAAGVQRAITSPQTASASGLLALQRTAGNQAVVRLLGRTSGVQRADMPDEEPPGSSAANAIAAASEQVPAASGVGQTAPGLPAGTPSTSGPSGELPAAPRPAEATPSGSSGYPGGGGARDISMGGPIGMPPEASGPPPEARTASEPPGVAGQMATPSSGRPSEELPAAPRPAEAIPSGPSGYPGGGGARDISMGGPIGMPPEASGPPPETGTASEPPGVAGVSVPSILEPE